MSLPTHTKITSSFPKRLSVLGLSCGELCSVLGVVNTCSLCYTAVNSAFYPHEVQAMAGR